MAMQFLSDNAAAVHPRVWAAMQAADNADVPYDGDALSQRLDEAFSALFGQPCAALWASSGTAANGLALAALAAPHGAVICHREAHIETSEGGAPAFYTHGAKLMLAEGAGAQLTPQAVATQLDGLEQGVHYVQPQALSITQASEYGLSYSAGEVAALGALCRERGLKLHMDGARFANAAAFRGCSPAAMSCSAGVDTLAFGMVKNGGMGAEALVLFDPELAELACMRRKRAGHLQSKGRFMAAQLLALIENDLWLANAAHANAAAQEIAMAAKDRLLHAVESNQLFLRMTPAERAALRAQGFGFYDWGDSAARIVTAWDSRAADVTLLARAIAAL